jgi:23S rRNA (uracil1939-C5)-methyltransferase
MSDMSDRRDKTEEEREFPRRPKPTPLDGIDELEVTIEKLVAGGDGLGRHEGLPVFVPRAAPGDRLRVAVTERKPGYGRGEILEILDSGPDRREAPCPYFERCGGCDLQHMEDAAQVKAKARSVVETLARLGGIDPPKHLEVVAGEAWGYRLRTQLHTAPARYVGYGERGVEPANQYLEGKPAVGYYRRGTRDLVAVESCPILVPELEQLLPNLPKVLDDAVGDGRPPSRIDLTAGDDGDVTSAPPLEGLPGGEVSTTVAGLTYRYDARCFFQGHRGLLDRLVELVVGPDEDGYRGESAVDLYSGVGLFSLPLARRYGRVTAVESDRIAARYAQVNARDNGITNLTVENRGVDGWVGELSKDVDRIVLDPPRAGLGARIQSALAGARVPRLTYVSCHPATLARDLKRLSGTYRLERLALVDLFPQTGHMEAVAQLVAVG